MSKKKILFMLMLILSLPLLFEIGNEPATRVDAASKKQRNQKAHKVYEKKLNSIMTKYKEDKDIFTSQAKSQKMFTTLSGTVSEETKERAFKQN